MGTLHEKEYGGTELKLLCTQKGAFPLKSIIKDNKLS